MENKVDLKRILIYLAFAFGIAWLWALLLVFNGGLVNSPVIIPFTNYTLAFFVLAFGYMFAPTLAHILTRLVTHEGWKNLSLRPKFKRGWPYWLAAWFLPGLLTLIGAVVFYLVMPQFYDPEMKLFAGQMEALAGATPIPMSMMALALLQFVQAILLTPILNGIFTFGEEFGWRAYLLPKLMPLGGRKAVLISGVIWGIWHWPVIAMGHNYGLEYAGAPWLGMLMMVVVTICLGALLSWVTLRGGSVWPAVIGHGAINGISAYGFLFLASQPNPLVGPAPTGVIGGIAFFVVTVLIFVSRKALQPVEESA
jgi:membrane protease YdiL (CAAX protease family)